MPSFLPQRVPIKQFAIAYLSLLLFASAVLTGEMANLWNAGAIVLAYAAADLIVTRFLRGVWYLPLSSIISGLILGLVALPGLWTGIILALVAVSAKHLLHFGRIRHIVNPAAFALAAVSFFTPVVSWWAPGAGGASLLLIIFSGGFILWHQRRWDTAGSYLAVYLAGLTLVVLSGGGDLTAGFFEQQITDGTLLFFVSVMLVDPLTSYFPLRKTRILFGVFAAAFAVAIAFFSSNLPAGVDPLLGGLLAANIIFNLKYLPPKPGGTYGEQ